MKEFLNNPNRIFNIFLGIFSAAFLSAIIISVNTRVIGPLKGRAALLDAVNTLNEMSEIKQDLMMDLVKMSPEDKLLNGHITALGQAMNPGYREDQVLEQMWSTNRMIHFNNTVILALLKYKDSDEYFGKVVQIMTIDRQIETQKKRVEEVLIY